MTIEEIIRRKEIEKEAKERFGEWPLNMQFVGGAEWADENPRKGLVDIEKVCAFLKDRIEHDSIDYPMATMHLIDDLKRYVEENKL